MSGQSVAAAKVLTARRPKGRLSRVGRVIDPSGRRRAQNRREAVPGVGISRGDFAHLTAPIAKQALGRDVRTLRDATRKLYGIQHLVHHIDLW